MIANYFKIAVRNILKHKFFSAINILGMTVGVTACLLILLYVKDELSYDRFHQHADRIYQVGLHGKIGDQDLHVANTCPPLAAALVNEVPEIEDATRLSPNFGELIVKVDDKSFIEEKAMYADSNFFSFFTFHLREGDASTCLKEPNSVVLTEKTARKYFAAGTALGKLMVIGNENKTYKVTGIVEEAPSNSHVHFDLLLSANSADYLKSTVWLNNFLYTYFRLKDQASVEPVKKKFDDLVVKYVGPEIEKYMGTTLQQLKGKGGTYGFYVTPMIDIRLHSTSQGDLEPGGNIVYVYSFGIIAVFIILIACINFMNMSTARSAGRAKEVGLRKALGSLRQQMIGQFLMESLIYSFMAVVLAVLAVYLLIPGFNSLSGKELNFASLWDAKFLAGLLGVLIFVAVVAGSYPAFYLTSFNVVEVLKGKIRAGVKSHGIRSALVVFQFAISIFLMIATGIVYNQLNYMQQRDLGFDKHNVIYLNNIDRLGTNMEPFRNAVSERSDVKAVSFTNNSLPGVNNTTIFKSAGSDQDHIMGVFYADDDHQEVMKFKLIKGRYFSKDFPSDSLAIVLNEAAVREFGWTDPIGAELRYKPDGTTEKLYKVVGVVKDFNFETLKSRVRPISILLGKTNGKLAIRYEGNSKDVLDGIETTWKQFAAGAPFQFKFLDENYDELFRAEQRMSKIFTVFAGLAIFIACLGLFALAAFTAEQRTKEIGIRKAMGATVPGLALMISKEFTRLVIIAFVLVVGPAWWAVTWWLESFAYRIEVQLWVFAVGGLAAIFLAWITVGYQSLKAASTNPVTSLRYE